MKCLDLCRKLDEAWKKGYQCFNSTVLTKVFTDFIHKVKFPEFDNYCGENTKEGNYEGIGYYLRGELI